MGLSEEITRLANEYDPEREFDARSVAKLIQGSLYMYTARDLTQIVKTADVELNTDANGNYADYFTIVTESGLRIRVSVEPEL